MKLTKTVAEQIFEVEGFEVRFVSRDGSDITQRRVDDYRYERAARHNWTVARWRDNRFTPNYPDFDVEVLAGDGRVVHGKTLLSTVRGTYAEQTGVPPRAARSRSSRPTRSTVAASTSHSTPAMA
jgi:hypothetical protein